jgi:hypothetical protein
LEPFLTVLPVLLLVLRKCDQKRKRLQRGTEERTCGCLLLEREQLFDLRLNFSLRCLCSLEIAHLKTLCCDLCINSACGRWRR